MENLFDEYSIQELLTTDIQFLSLQKKPWEFSRGARTERVYLYQNGSTAIRDFYTYTMDSENKNVVSTQRTLQWFDDLGNVKLEKDISTEQNVKGLKSLNRAIRQGRIDYLESAAASLATAAPLVPEPYKSDFEEASQSIDILFNYYETEVNHYISRGTSEFEDAVNNETSPVMLRILNLKSYIPDSDFPNGLKIKDAIMWQLKGIKP